MPFKSGQTAGESEALIENKVEEPPRYMVLMHNDDYTTMDFVIDILCRVFHKNLENATAIMLEVHTKGIGQCGVYTREIAEAKVAKVRNDAQLAGFPLRCSMEKV